jgi:hypothetical protein
MKANHFDHSAWSKAKTVQREQYLSLLMQKKEILNP